MTKKVYIFIPGYYGSTLIDPNSGRVIWGDTKEVLFGRQTLAMPINSVNIPGALYLEPHLLINDKKLLGGLIKEDAYDKTINFLKAADAEEIFSVAWDWRRDPILGVRLLDQTVKVAKKKYPHHELILVSHSFGSLVSSYYLRYGTQDYFEAIENWEGLKHFSKIILSACPYRGVMSIFRNMINGIKFGLNHKMQNSLAFCTFESSYYLLPPPGLDLFSDENQSIFSLNLHDPKTWVKNNLGLFQKKFKFSNDSLEARLDFVSLHLLRAKKLHELIEADSTNLPEIRKKILYLSGHGFKTVNRGVVLKNAEEESIFLYYPRDFKKYKSFLNSQINPQIVFGDGDSTVTDFSLKLPSSLLALQVKEVHENQSHLNILQNIHSQKLIYDFIKQA